jgi:hypothetical protein
VDGVFLDPVTLKPLALTYPDHFGKKGDRAWTSQEGTFTPSADGTAFGRWSTNQSPTEVVARVVEGGEVKTHHVWNLKHIVPGPDGRWFYTAKGIVTRELKRAAPDDEKYGYCLPATSGDYFLSLTSANERDRTGGTFTVYHRGMKGPIGRSEKADHGMVFDGWDRDPWGPWRRVFFVPEAKVIIVLPVSNDRVVLHKFDVDAALEKSGLDYLFVTSQAPRGVKAGAAFTYPLRVKSKHGGADVQGRERAERGGGIQGRRRLVAGAGRRDRGRPGRDPDRPGRRRPGRVPHVQGPRDEVIAGLALRERKTLLRTML